MKKFIIYFILKGGLLIDSLKCKEVPDAGLFGLGHPPKLVQDFGNDFAEHVIETALCNANEGDAGSYRTSGEVELDEKGRAAFKTEHEDCTVIWELKEQPYSISGLKTWDTHDGGGYQGNLLKDGKKIGTFHNDGNGGCIMVEFWKKVGKETKRNKEESEAFDSYLKGLPDVVSDMPDPHDKNKVFSYPMDDDIFIADLVEEYEAARWFKRQCAKETLFRLKGDTGDNWRVLKIPYGDQARKYLEGKYANEVREVANITRV